MNLFNVGDVVEHKVMKGKFIIISLEYVGYFYRRFDGYKIKDDLGNIYFFKEEQIKVKHED